MATPLSIQLSSKPALISQSVMNFNVTISRPSGDSTDQFEDFISKYQAFISAAIEYFWETDLFIMTLELTYASKCLSRLSVEGVFLTQITVNLIKGYSNPKSCCLESSSA